MSGPVTVERLAAVIGEGYRELRHRSIDPMAAFRYVPALLLLKWLSDNVPARGSGAAAPDALAHVQLPDASRWSEAATDPFRSGAYLSQAFDVLEAANPWLVGVGGILGFDRRDNAARGDAAAAAAGLGFMLHNTPLSIGALATPNAPGQAFDAFLHAAAGEWKSGVGEQGTPPEVAELLVRLVEITPGMVVCDPACGWGDVLVRVARRAAAHSGVVLGRDRVNVHLFGQERNGFSWALCQINLLLNGVARAHVEMADAISAPLVSGGALQLYDRVASRPAFGARWNAAAAAHDRWNRFTELPPRHVGDWAMIQHALATLEPEGRAALLVTPGALFRGGAEARLREKMVTRGNLEAAIALPPNLFYGTSIPAVIVVVREKPGNGGVLLVDASEAYERGRPRNLLSGEHAERIEAAVHRFEDEPGFAHVATSDELRTHKFDLDAAIRAIRPTRVEFQDPVELLDRAHQAEAEAHRTAGEIDRLLKGMGILPPETPSR